MTSHIEPQAHPRRHRRPAGLRARARGVPRPRHRAEEAPPGRTSARSSPSCSRTATPSASRSRRWPGPRRSSPTRASRPSCGVYNPLIPEPGPPVGHAVHRAHLRRRSCGSGCRSWWASSGRSSCGSGPTPRPSRCTVDPDHDKQLTRDEITASVHYVRLRPHRRPGRGASPPARWRWPSTTRTTEHDLELTEGTRAELLARPAGQLSGRLAGGHLTRNSFWTESPDRGILDVPAHVPTPRTGGVELSR